VDKGKWLNSKNKNFLPENSNKKMAAFPDRHSLCYQKNQ
jgi:hypothetical protein